MRGKVLLGCCALMVFAAVETRDSLVAQGAARNVNVNVRLDCLDSLGVGFTLTPWLIELNPGDSINWNLDSGSNVNDMMILNRTQGNRWPFRRKPPYRSTKERPAGAQSLDGQQNGRRYRYAVFATCVRESGRLDTVIVDPDMIIRR